MSIKKDINCERGCVFSVNTETGENTTTLTHGGFKLNTTDWVEKFKTTKVDSLYEVRFKNTRKGYYENVNELPLKVGDIVAVEGNPGHDIGIVSMCADMVKKHIRAKKANRNQDVKKIYRIAKTYDIERWQEAISLEHPTMIKSRQITAELNLNMKIGDVEYQGDRVKAIFYYIADERVDFRELIKILAEEFKIRIEMKQIGARQEAGRIGGIGSCGRELCCSSFATNFVSVTTNSARFQDILLNPQKLAGQCGKLKCCLNYEVDSYIDARRSFPKISGPIQTLNQDYYLVKTDIFKGEMTFSADPHLFINTKVLSVDTVKDILSKNRRGVKVDELISEIEIEENEGSDYKNAVGDDSITRFDKKVVKKNNKRRPKNNDTRAKTQEVKSEEGTKTGGEGVKKNRDENNQNRNLKKDPKLRSVSGNNTPRPQNEKKQDEQEKVNRNVVKTNRQPQNKLNADGGNNINRPKPNKPNYRKPNNSEQNGERANDNNRKKEE